MGYTIGTRWTNDLIKEKINDVKLALGIERMPTSVEIIKVMNDSSLTNAIRRHGGYKYWADKLNLCQSECETRTGLRGELKAKEILESLGYKVDKMPVKHPYDLLVNDNIKIDCKVSKLFESKQSKYYTFNLEKKNPTCDIYIMFCIDDSFNIDKVIIIPSKFAHLTQLSVGFNSSKYDDFVNRWDYIEKYDKFYKDIE